MDLEEIRKLALKEVEGEMDEKIQELKKHGPIPKIREFEFVFQHILTGFGIPPQIDDTILEMPEILQSLQSFVKGRIDGTSLNINEIELFNEFVDNLSKDVDIASKYLDMLEAAHKEEPIYIYPYVKTALTKL